MKVIKALCGFVGLGLLMAGCSNPEAALIGDWKGAQGTRTVKADHTWSQNTPKSEGTWKLEGKQVTFKVDKIQGKTVKEAEAEIDKQTAMINSLPSAQASQAKAMIAKIKGFLENGMPSTLSDDGKSLTSKNPISDQNETMTKVEDKK